MLTAYLFMSNIAFL